MQIHAVAAWRYFFRPIIGSEKAWYQYWSQMGHGGIILSESHCETFSMPTSPFGLSSACLERSDQDKPLKTIGREMRGMFRNCAEASPYGCVSALIKLH
jgi:hypothetical protein